MLRQMTKEEMDNLKVGDKVKLQNGEESIIIAIDPHDIERFACTSNTESCNVISYNIALNWGRDGISLIPNWEDYVNKEYGWFSFVYIDKEEDQEIAPIKTKSCSCKECKGTGVIKTDFYDRFCGCPIGQRLIG